MIHYDPHNWLDHFFDVRGSLVKEIGVRVAVCGLWAAAVVLCHKRVAPIGISSLLHTLVGTALGLLLVIRTNSSYDRYWEGRKLWGGIVNECRNLIRSARIHLSADPELLFRLSRWTAVFPFTARNLLRGQVGLGPVQNDLDPAAALAVAGAPHPPLQVALEMTACLKDAQKHGLISDYVLVMLDQNIQQLVDFLGGCERIRKTPLPFAYVVHLRRLLVLYCFTLPFALVDTFGWGTIADTLLVSYTFFGIEEIGVEIEGPFGEDDNDLPLDAICEDIRRNVFTLAGMEKVERETLPEGL